METDLLKAISHSARSCPHELRECVSCEVVRKAAENAERPIGRPCECEDTDCLHRAAGCPEPATSRLVAYGLATYRCEFCANVLRLTGDVTSDMGLGDTILAERSKCPDCGAPAHANVCEEVRSREAEIRRLRVLLADVAENADLATADHDHDESESCFACNIVTIARTALKVAP